ncbi:MAG: tRNA guanosine(34) transglycosylase Tgt [Planctomycetes bacterium]|nr:tRNA guanosine(34) transglycosylase Tgt [Planctomycetota bacterium]
MPADPPRPGPPFSHRVEAVDRDTPARACVFRTPHGEVPTPCFMPVGTRGTVKGLTPPQLREAGARMILANAFHLLLRPGEEVVRDLGGLHALMAWDGPILTDSGGFQVFSLPGSRVDGDGVTVKSPVDGSEVRLTPERVIEVEEALGPDVAMPLDHCPPWPCTEGEAAASVERTLRWLERSATAKRRPEVALFGIVQGSVYPALRAACARAVAALDLPGNAVGGVSVGEPGDRSLPAVRAAVALLPADRPRYLMGVGEPEDLLDAVAEGFDLFDCVLPTRNGRNGQVLTRDGPLNLRNASRARERGPADRECRCLACREYPLGALRHLFQAGEMLGPVLASLHNITFLGDLMAGAREAVKAGRFAPWRQEAIGRYRAGAARRTSTGPASVP